MMIKTIKSKKEFGEVFHNGKRVASRLVRITVLKHSTLKGRIAFVAPKRFGNAVYRNRCKRVLREAASLCGLPHDSFSIILFATSKTHDAHPDEVARELGRLLSKIEK